MTAPGELFVDYAGDKIPIYDQQTGEVIFMPGCSSRSARSCTFAEATRSQDLILLD